MSNNHSSAYRVRTFVYYGDRIPHKACECGYDSEFYTNWKSNDSGRRYYQCKNYGEYGCWFREWYDPPMCERANKLIPGLLKKLNRYECNTPEVSSADADNNKVMQKKQEKILKLKNNVCELRERLTKAQLRCRYVSFLAFAMALVIVRLVYSN